ncbi:MAG TPA: HD domain-containing protein [Gemmatimonadaceae bacterium]|nr:HD domain-containing protein [Gemmatimonadaceae bacterium]
MTSPSDATTSVELPPWAQVSKGRRKHIVRVTKLLADWADAMNLSPSERQAWIDAGRFHDALRDAPVDELRDLAGLALAEIELLHGPATATKLQREGETRTNLLDAIRYHSIGWKDWDRVGQALYMADYLEPGRTFDAERRAALTLRVPRDFDGAFREVVRSRMAYAKEQGYTEYPESVELLASVG